MLGFINKNIHENIMNPLQDFVTSSTGNSIIYYYTPIRGNEFIPVVSGYNRS